jgi:uncharacterized membrane protein
MFEALRRNAERAWAAAVLTVAALLVVGSLLFPRAVYGGFLWHYFWGPVYADAHGAACAVWNGGARTLLYAASECRAAAEPVAYPGYTLVSEVGYMVTLVVALYGVLILLRRLDIGRRRRFFLALVPFVFFGGALRVVEDTVNAARVADATPALSYPWNAFIISPVIYFTVFAVTLAAVVASVALARNGATDTYEYPVAAIGTALAVLTIGYLGVLSATTGYVEFNPLILLVTLTGATLAAAATWWLVERYAPEVAVGTGLAGPVVVWGHAVDGVANVVGIDWGAELGLRADLVPKHPANRFVIDVTQAVLPPSIVHYTGTGWPFLLLKLVVAVVAVWLFNEEIYEESPRYTILLLVAILAVGLGPGTRDMLRATFGV